MAKFCRRCGNGLEAGDLFCGDCGAPVPGAAGDADEPTQASPAATPEDDFWDDWDRGIPAVKPEEPPAPPPPTDEAVTESIPTARPHDTAVLPAQPSAPYMAPGSQRPAPPVEAPPPHAHPRPAPAPSRGFPWGAAFALIGAIAVIVSALLPWSTGRPPELGPVLFPRDIGFVELVRGSADGVAGPSLGLILLGAGLLGALVALFTMAAPVLKFLRRIIGLLTLGVVALFVVRLVQAVLTAGDPNLLWDTVGVGVYVAAVGAFTQMVAGKWFRR